METFTTYLITNKNNGKMYVGVTKHSVEERWLGHVYVANIGAEFLLSNAIRKHGTDAFEISVLETSSSLEEMKASEIKWISELKTYVHEFPQRGYNMTRGGDGTWGHRHTDETKKKMSDVRIGIEYSDEVRKNMSLAHLGLKATDKTRQKQSIAKLGKKKSFETRKKMSAYQSNRTKEHLDKISQSRLGKPMPSDVRKKISETNKGVFLTTEQKMKHLTANFKNRKPLFAIDVEGNCIVTYFSINDAIKATGMTLHSLIPKSLKKRNRFLNGVRYVLSDKTIAQLSEETIHSSRDTD